MCSSNSPFPARNSSASRNPSVENDQQVLDFRKSLDNEIIQSLKESRLIVVEGTLYPLLTRLKNAGLLDYEWEESPQGPPRKYYRLTETGRAFLNELESAWIELNRTVEHIREI